MANTTSLATPRVMAWFQRADAAEYRLCLNINRLSRRPRVRRLFCVVSRLGDGVFWYTLMLLLPAIYGQAGLLPMLRMALVGVVGLALYKTLKRYLNRERPYISLHGVEAGMPPLDRYSFPSGHTLHAVSFSTVVCASFPELAWLCVPFAALVAASRVVLGLHYPSDVAVGATLGMGVALSCIKLLPIG